MRRFFIPEVVQTSSLDCGPAALKAMLEGFGRPASYGRLREACQTGLDGTSIDTMESVAQLLGLEAEQIMLPLDHLLLPAARALPAIVVVTVAQGLTHFVVVWRRLGPWLQIMDPAVGRRWIHHQSFLKDVFQHATPVSAAAWLDHASSEDFQRVLRARQANLGIRTPAAASPGWRGLSALDAALRLAQSLVDKKGLARGRTAQAMVDRFAAEPDLIPADYCSVLAADPDEEGQPQVLLRGAVLVRVKSKRPGVPDGLPDELAAALHEKPARPLRTLAALLFNRGQFIWPLLLTAVLAAAIAAFLEALLFRALLDVNATLALTGERLGAAAAAIVFGLALLLLELPAFLTGVRLGRLLENRLRMAFFEKLPKLSDRYFHSRPISDMAERSHILHRLRHLPDHVRQLVLAVVQLGVTAAGVVWLDPRAWPFMLASVAAALLPLVSSHALLAERDLRVRTHSGGLMRFYLDAMLGLIPIRTHGAAANLLRQQAALLDEWTQASFRLQRALVLTEGVQLLAMFSLVAALFLLHPYAGVGVGRVLLMAYWALNMPALGQDIAAVARQYPNYRSVALRLLEPLNAPEEELPTEAEALLQPPAIQFHQVDVVVSGNPILTGVSTTIAAGSHVAIVGQSGAGKSTLVGLLLGWLKPHAGEILINGQPLQVEQLRCSTAWVDPAVQLWNASLQHNLAYGGDGPLDFASVIQTAALRHVVENLPQGLQTALGENGGLVSGGEGQRVRFGRALQRPHASLVILDEPFRGLDRDRRRELLARARQHWSGATLLCITHDVAETRQFDRVLVIEQGRLLEDDCPQALAANPVSRFAQLLRCEQQTRSNLWEANHWRRIRLHSGHLVEELPRPANPAARESEVA